MSAGATAAAIAAPLAKSSRAVATRGKPASAPSASSDRSQTATSQPSAASVRAMREPTRPAPRTVTRGMGELFSPDEEHAGDDQERSDPAVRAHRLAQNESGRGKEEDEIETRHDGRREADLESGEGRKPHEVRQPSDRIADQDQRGREDAADERQESLDAYADRSAFRDA